MQSIERERGAMMSLRERIAAVEETNEDLLAFARGHAGAVTVIHEAVLALLCATDLASFARIVTCDWPCVLGVDAVALAWMAGEHGIVADEAGLRAFEPRLIARMAGIERAVTARSGAQGHPVFGRDHKMIRAEITIRLEGTNGLGLLLLGQHRGLPGETATSVRLLRFLGRTCSTMLERWPLA